jgi:hypothetical protein
MDPDLDGAPRERLVEVGLVLFGPAGPERGGDGLLGHRVRGWTVVVAGYRVAAGGEEERDEAEGAEEFGHPATVVGVLRLCDGPSRP